MYTLRQATEADYDFLYRLHVLAMREYIEATWGWREDWQVEYFQKKWNPTKRKIIVIEGQDAGVLVAETRSDELYIGLIELLPTYQRHGIGTAVIQDMIRAAQKAGLPLTLHVLKSNEPARYLYERLGFAIIDEEEVRYKMRYYPSGN